MKAYFAKWPNGDVSIVVATSEFNRDDLLDEEGDPGAPLLVPIKFGVAAHFRINEKYNPADEEREDEPFIFTNLDETQGSNLRDMFEEQLAVRNGKPPKKRAGRTSQVDYIGELGRQAGVEQPNEETLDSIAAQMGITRPK